MRSCDIMDVESVLMVMTNLSEEEIQTIIDNIPTSVEEERAFEELQRYRAIGTIAECREARDKRIPKKPRNISGIDENDNANVECPICRATTDYAIYTIKRGHCWKCGQLLDWSDEDEID